MKKIYIILFNCFNAIVNNINAQSIYHNINLISNNSFENTDSCTGYSYAIYYLNDWRQLNNTATGYLNACAPRPDEMPFGLSASIPYTHSMNAFQYARTGNAMIEVGVRYFNKNIQYASYLEAILTHPLLQDSIYCVELYSNVPNYMVEIENRFLFNYFTILLSGESIDTSRYDADSPYYEYEPSLRLYQQLGAYLDDTLNWVKLSGEYKALGGEKFFTIGAFNIPFDDVKVIKLTDPKQTVGTLFIDDVAVYKGKCREEEKPQKTFFNLYPNPGSGLFSLNYGVAQDAQLVVYDILGRTVLSETLAADKVLHHFNLSQMSNGMYFLKVISKDDENLFSQKFLLQR